MKATTILLLLGIMMMPTAATADPSMWMVQTNNDIELMVNTSNTSMGVNAWIHFDATRINITDVDISSSPWQPLAGAGWSHQGDHVVIALTDFEGITAGEYKISTLSVECVADPCTSEISIDHAEPVNITTYNLTYTYDDSKEGDSAVVSIGNGTGTVVLPIIVSNATNVGAVDVTLAYNQSVVSVVDVTPGDMDCTYMNLEHKDAAGWIRVGATQSNNLGLSGTYALLYINFTPVTSNAKCSLDLTVTTFKDATPNCTAMDTITVSGTYISSLNGDVNRDDVVDMADSMYLAKHIIGLSGYEVIDEAAAEVSGDGVVDMADSMYIAKHVLEIAGYEELM